MKSTGRAAPTKPGGTQRKIGWRGFEKRCGQDLWYWLASRGMRQPRKLAEPKGERSFAKLYAAEWAKVGANKKGRSHHRLRLSTWTFLTQRSRLAGLGMVHFLNFDFKL